MMDKKGKMVPVTDAQLLEKLLLEPAMERSLKPIFHKGEYVELKGRWFRIKNFNNGLLVLKGMPVDFEPDPSTHGATE